MHTMEVKRCISTKKRIDNDAGAVMFKCPSCSDYEVVRSKYARQNALRYACPKCNFTGPN